MADSARLFALSFCICNGEGLPERSVKRGPSFLGIIYRGLVSPVICLSRIMLAR